MAQTEIAQFKIPLMKPTNTRTPVEVGDTVTLVLFTDDETYATKTVVLTYVNALSKEYGWDREVTDVRSLDVKRASDIHSPHCS